MKKNYHLLCATQRVGQPIWLARSWLGLRFSTIAIVVVMLQTAYVLGQPVSDAAWQPMFNGQNLEGWRLVNTPAETWSFRDGVLRCTGKPIGEIRTERMYQNFEMEIEWRHLVPGGNAGIFVWADDITAKGVPFHRGIEVQVLENAYGNTDSHTTHGDIFPIHGADMRPVNGRGGKRAFPTAQRSLPSPEWNHYRIVCLDGSISLAVNGEVVTRGEYANPRKGYICLESEGGVVEYRQARIRELPATPMDAKYVAQADRGFRSIYSGLDLRGWMVDDSAGWLADDWVLRLESPAEAIDGTLTMEFTEQVAGLVIDFRFLHETRSFALQIPGGESVVDVSRESTSPFALLLDGAGRWNRLEADMRGETLTWIVNGTEVHSEQRLGAGRLSITPQGPIELANLYVRP